jgi:hypothetical protein
MTPSPDGKVDAGIRNAEHFLALGICIGLHRLLLELEVAGVSPATLAEVMPILERLMAKASIENTEVKA